jgi:starch phosphorylase
VRVELNGLQPQDLRVELKAYRSLPEYAFEPAPLCSYGHGVPDGQWRAQFQAQEPAADGSAVFDLVTAPPGAGQYRVEIRVYPWHRLLTHPLEMGLMKRL